MYSAGLVGPAEHEGDRALARRAEHVLRERVRHHRRRSDLLLGHRRCAARRSGSRRRCANAFTATLARVDARDAVLVHVALDLQREELRGQHHPRLAVPAADAHRLGVGVERAPRVLVEADREAEVGRAGADRALGHREGAASGRAAVPHVDERQAGEAELVDEGVGVAAVAAAAERELGSLPRDAGVGERQRGSRARPAARPDTPSVRPNGWMPMPTMATPVVVARSSPRRSPGHGRKANVDDVGAVGARGERDHDQLHRLADLELARGRPS